MGIITTFYLSHLMQGFFIGLVIRIIFAIMFKSKMTFGGFVRSGVTFAIINIILKTMEVYY